MRSVRITVIKKAVDDELAARHMTEERRASFRPCGHEIGESFVVAEPVMCPEGLCPWAWHDIESFVRIVAFEGRLEGSIPAESWVRCCTDAFRPVTFLIEPAGNDSG
ncbi:MAG: TIGR04076 family protein [Candidatus Bipolaricaulota bacterium]|nr:MAG: TIGR04076 family protein [Candidatus Bipolaricaulota bacterium]